MEPAPEPLELYGRPSHHESLDWSFVDEQLAASPTYWTVGRGEGPPHARPVWGVWRNHRLHLSIGSPTVIRQLVADPVVTVHLESGTDVVIVEGEVTGHSADAAVIAAYDAKYDWHYDLAEYGLLHVVTPHRIMAWRSYGFAGRDGFHSTGRWRFPVWGAAAAR